MGIATLRLSADTRKQFRINSRITRVQIYYLPRRHFRGIDEPLNIIVLDEMIDNAQKYALLNSRFPCSSRENYLIIRIARMRNINGLSKLSYAISSIDDELNYLTINHTFPLSKPRLFNRMSFFLDT